MIIKQVFSNSAGPSVHNKNFEKNKFHQKFEEKFVGKLYFFDPHTCA